MVRYIFVVLRYLVSLSLGVPWSLQAQEKLVLHTEVFTPYQFIEQGQLVGINTDFVKQACQRAQIACEFKVSSWKRAFEFARTKPNSGVFSTFRDAERESQFNWVGPLINSPYTAVYALKDRNDIEPAPLDQLTHLTIGVMNSDILARLLVSKGFKYNHNLYPLEERLDDLTLFFNGRLDLLTGSQVSMPYRLASLCFTMDEIKPIARVRFEGKGNYLALNKQTSETIKKKLQKAIDSLRNDGQDKTILQRYTNPALPSECRREVNHL